MKSQKSLLIVAVIVLLVACKPQRIITFKEVYNDSFSMINSNFWGKATHTFENNLAHFNPVNLNTNESGLLLKVTPERMEEKRFSAAELRSLKAFKYGKFTIRMKASSNNGVVSAFFLYSLKSKSTKEIDIEFTGKNTSVIHLNYWTGLHSRLKTIPLGFDASREYHDYSIVWLRDQISWEVDGREIHRVKNSVLREPLHLMINLWPSKPNDWAGNISAKHLPAEAKVEYVKVYSIY